jgi:hypothetical protein
VEDYCGHLAGRVAHLMAINPERGRKMKALFDKVIW